MNSVACSDGGAGGALGKCTTTVNPEAVVERFARAHPRRLLFTNPLIDDPADVESSASV